MTEDYNIKDSGKRAEFETGAVRDAADGKPRPELLNPLADTRLAIHMAKGAAKYAARNWEKGIPYSRFVASLKRHLNQWLSGETDEDHLVAMVWNAYCLLATDEMINRGILPESLRDLPDYRVRSKSNFWLEGDPKLRTNLTAEPDESTQVYYNRDLEWWSTEWRKAVRRVREQNPPLPPDMVLDLAIAEFRRVCSEQKKKADIG